MNSDKNQYETVILRGNVSKGPKKPNTNDVVPKFNGGKNVQNKPAVNLVKLENDEVKIVKSTVEMGREIMMKRNEKNLTQAQVDQLCSLPKGTVAKYENGTAIFNQSELTKINTVLGLKLKKPKEKVIK